MLIIKGIPQNRFQIKNFRLKEENPEVQLVMEFIKLHKRIVKDYKITTLFCNEQELRNVQGDVCLHRFF